VLKAPPFPRAEVSTVQNGKEKSKTESQLLQNSPHRLFGLFFFECLQETVIRSNQSNTFGTVLEGTVLNGREQSEEKRRGKLFEVETSIIAGLMPRPKAARYPSRPPSPHMLRIGGPREPTRTKEQAEIQPSNWCKIARKGAALDQF
jgi:hypothetical protein